jgi:ribonucleotide monophosphatase NagD (HAD superfamily)
LKYPRALHRHFRRDTKLDYAFAFDIDGVLLLGNNAIPAGARAMKKLDERKIPYILLTNGGGKSEPDRVAELGRFLGVNVIVSSVSLT